MNRKRRHLFAWLTEKAIALSPNRMDARERSQRLSRETYISTVTRWPLRMTEYLRDRLRATWLTLRR